MRALCTVVVTAVLLGACGGDEQGATPDAANRADAGETDGPSGGPGDEEVSPDVLIADAPEDVIAVMDAGVVDDVPAPRDVRDGATDVPRDVVDAARVTDVPRDVAMDVPRVADGGVQDVPLPGTVAPGETCHALLRGLGLSFTVGPTTRGVVDPVTVTTPINGVRFFSSSYSGSERPLLMDCRLGVALHLLTRELRARWNVNALVHYGIYNYRVIAGTTTLSQHAYAMGIDLANFRTAAGTTHSVLNDFTMNGRPTCPPRPTTARDRVLKEVACWMYDSRAFNIVLTPNYNAAHRDHYHVDLTAGSHFIGAAAPAGVDPPSDPFFDLLVDDY